MDATLVTEMADTSIPSQLETKIILKAPRAAWVEFLLHFCTLGAYSSFWLVGRIREFKQLHKTDYIPWLWIFVFSFPLVQFFTLPKFIEEINRLEDKAKVTQWKRGAGLWVVLVFFISLAFNASSFFEVSAWLLLVGCLVWAGLMTLVHIRIDRAKRNLQCVEFKTPKFKLFAFEFILLGVFSLIISVLLYAEFPSSIFTKTIERYAAGSIYTNEENQYQFTLVGDGWTQVPIGTYSDGEATAEFQGPLSDMYFMIFNHGIDETVTSVAYWRVQQYADEDIYCEHNRKFSVDGKSVVAQISCKSSLVGDPVLGVSTVIKTPKGILEMSGYLSSTKFTYKKYEPSFKKMAEGFTAK